MYDEKIGDLKFCERIYLAPRSICNGYYTTKFLASFSDIDEAVQVGDEVSVGIYQLVRVAKFKKTSVEVKTLKEIPASHP